MEKEIEKMINEILENIKNFSDLDKKDLIEFLKEKFRKHIKIKDICFTCLEYTSYSDSYDGKCMITGKEVDWNLEKCEKYQHDKESTKNG